MSLRSRLVPQVPTPIPSQQPSTRPPTG
jgi:hypothetical protein